MLTATILAVFYIPLFFVLVRRSTRDLLKRLHHDEEVTAPPAPEGAP
jgi:multidrug efflux pump